MLTYHEVVHVTFDSEGESVCTPKIGDGVYDVYDTESKPYFGQIVVQNGEIITIAWYNDKQHKDLKIINMLKNGYVEIAKEYKNGVLVPDSDSEDED